jgi:hypothetical protein
MKDNFTYLIVFLTLFLLRYKPLETFGANM